MKERIRRATNIVKVNIDEEFMQRIE